MSGIAQSVTLADFNGDQMLDLAVANDGSYPAFHANIAVMLGTGAGEFADPTQYGVSWPVPQWVGTADLNGDQMLDLVSAKDDYNSTIDVLLGVGDGTFTAAGSFAVGHYTNAATLGNFNGDNVPDVAVALGNDTVSVLLGVGDGSFAAPVLYATGDDPIAVAVGDLNGDQVLDLVTANLGSDDVSVLLGVGVTARLGHRRHLSSAAAQGPWRWTI